MVEQPYANEPIPKEIEVGGVRYLIDDLPIDIRDLIQVYTTWQQELDHLVKQQNLDKLKLEAALQGMSHEIKVRFAKLENKNA